MAGKLGSARRYASALFSLAVEHDTLDSWGGQLLALGRAISEPGATRALAMPAGGIEMKRAALEAAGGPLSREVGFIVNLLLERKRIDLLPQVAEAFAAEVRQHRGIELADVTTAVPLEAAERELLAQRLSVQFGRQVEMTTRVNPDIIGGVVVRVRDQLYDASVRSKLETLRRRLVSGVLVS